MAIKNINEIRSDNYVKYDQQFVRDTLDALANSGQRFGVPGEGLIKNELSVKDIFPEIKLNNTVDNISCSYLQCNVKFDINNENKPNIYFEVNNIYKQSVDNASKWTSYKVSYCNSNPVNDYTTINKAIYKIDYGVTAPDEIINKKYYDYTSSDNLGISISYDDSPNWNYKYNYNIKYSDTISYVSECIDNDPYVIQSTYVIDNNSSKVAYMFTLVGTEKVESTNYLKYIIDKSTDYFLLNHTGTSTIIDTSNINNINNKKLTTSEKQLVSEFINHIFTETYYKNNLVDTYLSYVSTNTLKNLPFEMFFNFILRIGTEYYNERLKLNKNGKTNDIITFTCYLNSDYSFNVIRSYKENSIIYNTDDITVEYCKGEIEKTIEEHILDGSKYTEANKYILVDWRNDKKQSERKADAYDKYAIYNIINDIDYKGNVNLFYPIKVINTLTMPYLSEDNYWCINGFQTGIKATGKDAVQPSTIIIEDLKGSKTPEIISYLYNEKLNDVNKEYITNEKVNISIPTVLDNLQKETCEIETPILNLNNLKNEPELEEFVKVSMLISIKQLNDSKESTNAGNNDSISIISENGKIKLDEIIPGGFIMTFWVYDENKDKFVCVSDSNGVALDIGKLANLNKVIKNSLNNINEEPDRFYHSQLVFDTIDKEFKQIQQHRKKDLLWIDAEQKYTELNNTDIYPLIYNTLSYIRTNKDEAHGQGLLLIKSENSDEYRNDTILNVGFFNKIETDLSNNKIIDFSMGLTGDYATSFMNYNSKENTSYNLTPVGVQEYYDTSNANTTGTSVTYTNDYIPDGIYGTTDSNTSYNALYTPILDLGSILVNNDNFINRVGILTFGKPTKGNAYTYYSYIGTSYNNDNKHHFVLGTSTRNVNINRHVIDPSRTNNFFEQSDIDINFERINLNSHELYGNADFNYWKREILTQLRNDDTLCTATILIPLNENTISKEEPSHSNDGNNWNDSTGKNLETFDSAFIGYIKQNSFNDTPYISDYYTNAYITYVLSVERIINNYISGCYLDNIFSENQYKSFIECNIDWFDSSSVKLLPLNVFFYHEHGKDKPSIMNINLTTDIY